MATGTATIDFGTGTQRKVDASVVVTGQAAILTSSHVEAFMQGDTTADHSPDEHVIGKSMIDLVCSDIIAGTGFTIYGIYDHQSGVTGQFTVHWVWV